MAAAAGPRTPRRSSSKGRCRGRAGSSPGREEAGRDRQHRPTQGEEAVDRPRRQARDPVGDQAGSISMALWIRRDGDERPLQADLDPENGPESSNARQAPARWRKRAGCSALPAPQRQAQAQAKVGQIVVLAGHPGLVRRRQAERRGDREADRAQAGGQFQRIAVARPTPPRPGGPGSRRRPAPRAPGHRCGCSHRRDPAPSARHRAGLERAGGEGALDAQSTRPARNPQKCG